jgi:hypothetical protein
VTDRRHDILFYVCLGAALVAGAAVYFAVIAPNRSQAALSLNKAAADLAASQALCADPKADDAAGAAKPVLADIFEKEIAPGQADAAAAMRAAVETFVFRLPKKFRPGDGASRLVFEQLLERARQDARDSRLFANAGLGFTDSLTGLEEDADEDNRKIEGLVERLAVSERVLAAVRASGVKDVDMTQLARKPRHGAPGMKWSIEPVSMEVKFHGDEKSLARFIHELQNVDRVMPRQGQPLEHFLQERREADAGNGFVCLKDLAVTVKDAQKAGIEVKATVYGAFYRNRDAADGPKPGAPERRPPLRRGAP